MQRIIDNVKGYKEVKGEKDCQAEVNSASSGFWKTRVREVVGAEVRDNELWEKQQCRLSFH